MSVTDIAMLVVSAGLIPWLIFITRAVMLLTATQEEMKTKVDMIPKIRDDVEDLAEAHAPGPDGVQEWKNPGHRQLAEKQLAVLTSIDSRLATEATKMAQLFQGQSEVKAAILTLRTKQ